jgi:4-hydroxy-tetrahydrodipicolinate synthase
VVSNEIPAEMTQLVRCCLENDFEQARRLQRRFMPLIEVTFVESNPIPVKSAMAAMGLLEPVWRLPLCPPRPENEEKIRGVLECLGLVGERHAARAN